MEFQRFNAPDPAALEARITETQALLDAALQAGDAAALVEHAADLGSLLTTARREAEALELMAKQQGLAESRPDEEASGWFWNAYATALQYLGRRDEAHALFAKASALCRQGGWQRLQAFVQQHWGRSLVEQGRWAEAEAAFTEALRIRRQLNDPLQASSERALAGLALLRPPAGAAGPGAAA